MESNHLIELFVSRGMIDDSLAEDMLSEMETSGKDIGDILADFQVVGHKDDIWPIIASELGADLIDLKHYTPPEELHFDNPDLRGLKVTGADGKEYSIVANFSDQVASSGGRDIKSYQVIHVSH